LFKLLTFITIGSRQTLKKIQDSIQANKANQIIIAGDLPAKTNFNSKKPDILRQLVRAFCTNNRVSNGRQKGTLNIFVKSTNTFIGIKYWFSSSIK